MSYGNNYGQGGQQQYGQYDPYGQSNPYDQRQNNYSQGQGQANPYDQRQDNYSQAYGQTQQPRYGQSNAQTQQSYRPPMQQQSSSQYDEESRTGGYEMSGMSTRLDGNSNNIQGEVETVKKDIATLDGRVGELYKLRKVQLDDPISSSKADRAPKIAALNEEIMGSFEDLTRRVRALKSNPESGGIHAAQVRLVSQSLQQSNRRAREAEVQYSKVNEEQFRRQYLTVKPTALPEEIETALRTDDSQVFTQALMNSTRQGDSRKALSEVRGRHQDIKKMEDDMKQLDQLFKDLEAEVVRQDVAVNSIENSGVQVENDVSRANEQLNTAVESAKGARRKKWICLGIVIAILIVIAIIVAVVVVVLRGRSSPPSGN